MENISFIKSDDGFIIKLAGHIDSTNAGAVEEELNNIRAQEKPESIIVDCEDLEYLSSAGLRIILTEVGKTQNSSIHSLQTQLQGNKRKTTQAARLIPRF